MYAARSVPGLYRRVAAPLCCFETLINQFCRNATTAATFAPAPDTYWGSFDEISKYNIHLSYLEKLWLAWYTYMQNDVLATGIMSFVMHEAVYFGRSLPWIIIDCIPWFRKYKIQQVGLATGYDANWVYSHLYSKKFPPPRNSSNALRLSS